VGRHQLKWLGTPRLCQHGAGDPLPVAVPRHGTRAWMMRGCAPVDPLGPQAVCRLGLLSGCHGEDILGKFSRSVSILFALNSDMRI
jgi:hypothetical protein